MHTLSPWLIAALLLPSLAACSLLDQIETALKNAVDCASCHALLVPLKTLALLGDTAFVDTITTVCKDFKIEDPDVCSGAISEQGPILAHDLRSIDPLGETATKLCSGVLGLCQNPAVTPYNVPFPKPAPSTPAVFTSSGKTPFQVVHFSDVHIDRQYATGSEANCTKPICCRNYADEKSPIEEPAGPNGNGKCDAPVSLAESMLEAVQQFGASAKFSIFTGDVVPHDVWSVNQSEATGDMEAFNAQMAQILKAPVFPTLGNHESAPVNSFPRNTTSTTYSSQWVFDTQSAGWTQWIGSAAASQVDHMSGSYSVVAPGSNLRIISLNTLYWYKENFWLYDNNNEQPDPNGVLGFTVQELQAAEDAGQRAWIIGHIPVGSDDVFNDQSNYYDQIVQRYKNTIAGNFFGHTHLDQFEIAYSDYSKQIAANAVSVGWICPSLTPTSGNPSFKIYDVDPDTFEVMDARVYIANISAPGFQTQPTWELYYSARESFGAFVGPLSATDSLSPAFWHNVTEAFSTNDSAFQLYNTYLSRGGKVGGACTGGCKNSTICSLRAMRAEDNCVVTTPGLPVSRRQAETHVMPIQSELCEDGGLGHILRSLVTGTASGSYSDADFLLLSKHLAGIISTA